MYEINESDHIARFGGWMNRWNLKDFKGLLFPVKK
jgi:hypothetical protein